MLKYFGLDFKVQGINNNLLFLFYVHLT